MELKNKSHEARKYGLIAIVVIILQGIIIQPLLYFKIKYPLIFFVLFFYWVVPFLVVYLIEKRDRKSLGFIFKKEKILSYLLYAVVGYLLNLIIFGISIYVRIHCAGEPATEIFSYRSNIFLAILIQVATVGFPEELFHRGYLLTRFSNWLGNTNGLLLTAFIFGAGHTLHRITVYGSDYSLSAIIIGIKTFIAALILGYQFLKTKSLAVPAVTHIVGNVFSIQIIELFLR